MILDCRSGASPESVAAAADAIAAGKLAVLATDTVYGIAADAFSPTAVQRLLDAKGRGRDMPPPVLIGATATLEALVDEVPAWLRGMVEEFWPGPLTVICRQQPSLTWDLGETRGTVAVRMPDHPVALAVLARTGPLAVSSANRSGEPAATTIESAEAMLGDSVAVYLDAGPSPLAVPSTILDATASPPRVVREGSIDLAELHRFNNTIAGAGG
jgi:tRNA threonylcarbamoyl adenosine modification protein (Sua5/YciO/YrdC/YwlC family)